MPPHAAPRSHDHPVLLQLGLEDTSARVACLRRVVSRVMQHLLCVIMQAQNHQREDELVRTQTIVLEAQRDHLTAALR